MTRPRSMSLVFAGLTVSCLTLAACTVTPAVTRTSTTMTPAEIAEMGLVCRTETPPDTNIPRTVCASEQAWAAYDRRTQAAAQEFFAEGRKGANTGRFVR